jgi:two-component system, LytTR family, response regulator LytT
MSNPYKIVIVEDEVLIAEHLSELLRDYGFEIVANCNTFDDGQHAINNTDYDIAILDINLDNGLHSGLKLGKLCAEQHKPFLFLTAYSDNDTITQAAKLTPNAYLIKPILGSSLFASIQVALSKHLKENNETEELDFVFIKVGTNHIKIYWNDVEAITHEKNYVRLRSSKFQTQGYLIRASLSSAMQSIIPKKFRTQFIQISRVSIANLSFVNHFTDKEVILPCGNFEIGDSYFNTLQAAVNHVKNS